MSLSQLTSAQLRKAAALQEEIESLNGELAKILNGHAAEAPVTAKPKKRTISAAHRAAIRAAQKARWAKIKVKA